MRGLVGKIGRCAVYTGLLCLAASISALGAPIAFQTFIDPHSVVMGGTIGIAFAGDKFVGSVQGDGTGRLYSTDLSGVNVHPFAPNVSLAPSQAGEHFVASSLGLGNFPSRDVYVGADNTVVHINNNGSMSNTFVSGLNGLVRGITFDQVGTFGGDMLVSTNTGAIYRVNSAGTPTLLANVGQDVEGMDVAPTGTSFNGFGGQLITVAEPSGLIRAIDTTGKVSLINPNNPIAVAEMIKFVPTNFGETGSSVEGFYAANYPPDVIKAPVSEWTSFKGDAIVTGQDSHQITRVHWNGSAFEYSNIGSFPNQPEDGIFVGPAEINPVPDASTLTLLGISFAAIAPALMKLRKSK